MLDVATLTRGGAKALWWRGVGVWLIAVLLLAAGAIPASAAASVPVQPPANAQSEIATLQAQVAALKDQRDLEKRLATLEGQTVAEDRSRNNLTMTITILGFIITFIAVVAGIASYYVGAARAVAEARGEVDKIRKEFGEFLALERTKIMELDGKITSVTVLAAEVEKQSEARSAKAEERLSEMRQMVEEAAPHLENIRRDAEEASRISRGAAESARIVEELAKAAAIGKKAQPTDEQIEAIEAVASESAEQPIEAWSVDQFKTAIGKAMYVDKNWREAERLSLAMERVHSEDEGARLYALRRRGDAARELRHHRDAEGAYRAVIAITTGNPTKRHESDYIWAAHHLAVCLINLRRAAEAEAMFRDLLPLRERVDGAEASGTLATHHALARAILDQGRAAEAEVFLRDLLPLSERVDGAEASNTLVTRHELACAILDQGRAAEAEAMFRDLLPLRERVDGAEASGTLATPHALARAILDQGRAAEAEAMFRDLLPLCERVNGPEASNTLVTRHELASAILDQGRAAEAEAMFRDLLPIRERVDGAEASGTLVTRYCWADALVQSGNVAGAVAALAPIPDPVANSDWLPRWEASLAFVRARVADALGDTTAADTHLDRADAILATLYPANHAARVKLAAYRAARGVGGGTPDA